MMQQFIFKYSVLLRSPSWRDNANKQSALNRTQVSTRCVCCNADQSVCLECMHGGGKGGDNMWVLKTPMMYDVHFKLKIPMKKVNWLQVPPLWMQVLMTCYPREKKESRGVSSQLNKKENNDNNKKKVDHTNSQTHTHTHDQTKPNQTPFRQQ